MGGSVNPEDDRFVADFDARLRGARRGPSAGATFGPGEVARWITLKADLPTDFSSPYHDLLVQTPRDEWEDAVRGVLGRRRRQEGAWSIAQAAYALAPELFDVTAVLRWLNRAEIWRWLSGRPDPARELRRVLADPTTDVRATAAGFLVVLDEACLPEVEGALGGQDLRRFGIFVVDKHLQRCWPRPVRHLVFEPGQLEGTRDKEHPSWHPPSTDSGEHVWGGMSDGWHHLITLDPMPADLGLSIPRLVLALDLDEAYEEGAEQFLRHGADGAPAPPTFELAMPPLAPGRVRLAPAPREAWVQDWGAANGTENLHRLGGLPVFVQDDVYPRCPDCRRPMVHLLSLDSGLRMTGAAPNGVAWWDWGSGGVANGFWCDPCRISCWTHACT